MSEEIERLSQSVRAKNGMFQAYAQHVERLDAKFVELVNEQREALLALRDEVADLRTKSTTPTTCPHGMAAPQYCGTCTLERMREESTHADELAARDRRIDALEARFGELRQAIDAGIDVRAVL